MPGPRLSILALLLAAAPAGAQQGWNAPRTLDLVARARETRHSASVDSALRSYQADARGYVYFFVDRPDEDERTLVKADQVALQLFWRAPRFTGQRIVGRREGKLLPTNIRYHLDHLTVVQDDFGDRIRLGDGDEVEAVLHPLGPGSEASYDFLLADSLTITFGVDREQVRVYEVRVRPRAPDRPGFVGSVFLDRETAAVVRMSFTFTPSSYVDPYLDYIRISLDNGRWLGRYWLPYRQEVELRREMPILDFLAGSVIRGRFEIDGYRFNEPIPEALFYGGRVSAAPPDESAAFVFERGLFDDLEEEGLSPPPSFEEIRDEAAQAVGRKYLSGLPRYRLHLASASDALRYDRAEGLFVGAGVRLDPRPALALRLSGGWAFGRARPTLGLDAGVGPELAEPVLRAYWDRLRDMGHVPGASGALNTFAAAAAERDYLDPWFARGVTLLLSPPGASLHAAARWERHRSAADVISPASGSGFRPVRAVEEGDVAALDLGYTWSDPDGVELGLTGTLARLNGRSYGASIAYAAHERPSTPERLGWSARIEAGAVTEDGPAQSLFLLGGRATLPGHPYRGFVGTRFWLARASVTHPTLHPWLGLRALVAVGGTRLGARTFPAGWGAPRDSGGVKASAGVGVALGWEVVRVDLARGLGGGDWEVVLSVTPRLAPWL